MTDPRQARPVLQDDELAQSLRELATSIAYPSAAPAEPGGTDLAERVRHRVELNPPGASIWDRLGLGGGRVPRSSGLGVRPMRRGLVLALVALLVLAAVAGAVGLGLPGLRILFGEGPSLQPSATNSPANSPTNPSASVASPSASIAPLGASLALGTALPLADVERLAGFDLLLPTDPDLGPPDATYLQGQRVALVWTSRTGLPETASPGVGLVISEFQGHVDEGFFQKILGPSTSLTRVIVGGSPGFWISDAPHFFMYVDAQGKVVTDDHRIVGDVLLWTTGDVTYRVETSLGMTAAIRLAESLR